AAACLLCSAACRSRFSAAAASLAFAWPSGLRMTGVRLIEGFFFGCAGSSESGSCGSISRSFTVALGGCGSGGFTVSCFFGGAIPAAGGVGGAGGGGLTLGLPPPETSASISLEGMKSKIAGLELSGASLEGRNAGPTNKMSASNRWNPVDAIKHFFCSRSILFLRRLHTRRHFDAPLLAEIHHRGHLPP